MSIDYATLGSVPTNLTEFTNEGLNIGHDEKVMTYLYGLSDFWVSIFEDPSKVNLLMETHGVAAADIYNNFLQLCTSISIEDVAVATNSQLKLVLLSEADLVSGEVETYKLPEKILWARFIANRPLLPTSMLEADVDYYLDLDNNTISFAKALNQLKFPFRLDENGRREYAIWFVDAKVDENLVYDYFAKLIGIDKPERSTENFKNFVYGMYYLYINGPTLADIRKGLNLVLGIPLARDNETVLEIRKLLDSDQYLVVTDSNSYLIPYGLEPTVNVDDTLKIGDEVSRWVEVKDWNNDGDWWINYYIPSNLVPHLPPDSLPKERYATAGSTMDYLMRNYLRQHTFLVNVNTTTFKNIQTFTELAALIKGIKPSYTSALYVWSIPTGIEELEMEDERDMNVSLVNPVCESVTGSISRFRRGNMVDPIPRSCSEFLRNAVDGEYKDLLGETHKDLAIPFRGGVIDRMYATKAQFRELTEYEQNLTRTILNRNTNGIPRTRGNAGFFRGGSVLPERYNYLTAKFPGYREIPLYITTMADVINKFASIGLIVPENKYLWTAFKPTTTNGLINGPAINDNLEVLFYDMMMYNFTSYFKRDDSVGYLGWNIPKRAYDSYLPSPGDIGQRDFLAFTAITEYTVGVFWMTQRTDVESPLAYRIYEVEDTLNLEVDGVFHRGHSIGAGSYYVMRGLGNTVSYNTSDSINSRPINSTQGGVAVSSKVIRDTLNPIPVTATRAGFSYKYSIK